MGKYLRTGKKIRTKRVGIRSIYISPEGGHFVKVKGKYYPSYALKKKRKRYNI